MSICSWIREACLNFWKLVGVSRSSTRSNEATVTAEAKPEVPASARPAAEASGGTKNRDGFSGGSRFIRTKFPYSKSDPTAATSSDAVGGEASVAGSCRQFYGRLKHCDSRTSVGGPLYRYVSSLSLELQAAVVAGNEPRHVHRGDCGSSWQERDIVATQLMDKLASRDLAGAARYCRLLLTLEPYNDEASRLLETLESTDRESPLLCEDDLVHAGYCSDDMDSENTGSETQFRYFHHDQHGLNEDERRSRRTTSESDAVLGASSSSMDSY